MSAPQNNCGYLGYSCCWANWANSSLANWSEPPQCFTLKVFTLKVSLSTFFFFAFETLPLASQNTFARLRIQTVRLAVPGCSAESVFPCLTLESGSTSRIIRRLGNHSQTLLFPCHSMLATDCGPIAELMFAYSAVYTLFTLCVCWCEGQMFTFWHGTRVTQTKTGRSAKTHKSQRREKANRRLVKKLFVELLE